MWLVLKLKIKAYSKPLFVTSWNAGCRLVWLILGMEPERHVFTLNKHHLCLSICSLCNHSKVLFSPLEYISNLFFLVFVSQIV